MFYAFLCILCILIQGTMVEQLCLNGFTLYKYICNKKKNWPLWGEYTGDRWIPRTKGQ